MHLRTSFAYLYLLHCCVLPCPIQTRLLPLASCRHADHTTQALEIRHARLCPPHYLPRMSSITSLLHDLHWLPMNSRISLRLAALVHRCRQGLAPSYLCQELHMVAAQSGRSRLRSASSSSLLVPFSRHRTLGEEENLSQHDKDQRESGEDAELPQEKKCATRTLLGTRYS